MVNILERLIDKAAGRDRHRPRGASPAQPRVAPAHDQCARLHGGQRRLPGGICACRTLCRGLCGTTGAGSEAAGLLRGLGFACHIKATGGYPEENCRTALPRGRPRGPCDRLRSISARGTRLPSPKSWPAASICRAIGIRLVQGDTDEIAMGGGHGSSRATYMAGTAIFRASEIVIEKGRALAARPAGGGGCGYRIRGRRVPRRRHRPRGRPVRTRRGRCARHLLPLGRGSG